MYEIINELINKQKNKKELGDHQLLFVFYVFIFFKRKTIEKVNQQCQI